ncbi:hypothetical protein I862_07400 [endosymbiont of Acanthamoeba sp. UWC8]|uniref:PD-(D/E)XK nuclease family protein n=1 Tax=endosymbiont of Acanthamoeba sp. UWC8 TaxID=86106 RepID=UPI0004D1F2FF|nr:PD-(D/E)XK nuclease family protein [endosymbiont of Acanthamoeba sp. UWC8]AIF82034.1 hypothetical protein I862_07400 [endosymbiont of Acanthamoeba sp. UWC8]
MLEINQQKSTLINAHIDKYLMSIRQPKRSYLGASRLGAECSRALQYEFLEGCGEINARTLRIFAIGHLFEALIIDWMKNSGFELATEDERGKQFGFEVAEGKIKGHIDGIIKDAPKKLGLSYPAIWECKSLNNKSWNDTVKRGVAISKPIYAAQIALYQAYMESSIPGISQNPALFTAINKDTAELYHELIPFDMERAQRMSDKAVNILRACDAGELLPRIAANPQYHICKLCSWRNKCWEESYDSTMQR